MSCNVDLYRLDCEFANISKRLIRVVVVYWIQLKKKKKSSHFKKKLLKRLYIINKNNNKKKKLNATLIDKGGNTWHCL